MANVRGEGLVRMAERIYQAVASCLFLRPTCISVSEPRRLSPPMKLHPLLTLASWLRSRRRRKGVADAKVSDMASARAEEKHQADSSDDACKTEANLGLNSDTTPAYTPTTAAQSLKVRPDTPPCPYSRPVEEIREEEYPHMSNGRASQHDYPSIVPGHTSHTHKQKGFTSTTRAQPSTPAPSSRGPPTSSRQTSTATPTRPTSPPITRVPWLTT